MRSTNIADLRNKLTQYLQEVRAGEEIVVRDRQRPIAKIVPFGGDQAAVPAHLLEMARAGLIRLGSGRLPKGFWKLDRPADPRGAALTSGAAVAG